MKAGVALLLWMFVAWLPAPVMALGPQPDLAPAGIAAAEGRFGVQNVGLAEAGPSTLSLTCVRKGGGECPDTEAMQPFRDPRFPGKWVVAVPKLAPGKGWVEKLPFWDGLKWKSGTYLIAVFVDAGSEVEEGDESNNLVLHQYKAEAAPMGTPQPQARQPAVSKPADQPRQ